MARVIVFALIGAVAGIFLFGALRDVVGPGPVLLISLAIVAVVLVIALQNLKSNRKVADATPEARAQALAFAPEAGKASLYLLRTQFVGKAVGANLAVDGRDVAQLKSPRFTRIVLAPGARKLSAYYGTPTQRKGEQHLDLNVSAGDIIVVQAAMEPQMVGSIVKLTRLDLDSARADLQKTRMVMADVGEV